jgi:hypothetical protein
LYDYRMTSRETRRHTGLWWERTLLGHYFPACQLASNSFTQQKQENRQSDTH